MKNFFKTLCNDAFFYYIVKGTASYFYIISIFLILGVNIILLKLLDLFGNLAVSDSQQIFLGIFVLCYIIFAILEIAFTCSILSDGIDEIRGWKKDYNKLIDNLLA